MENKRKRVGILTFHHSNHNFGAVLQTYASFTVLRSLGFSPTILNLLPISKSSFSNHLKSSILSLINSSKNFHVFRRKNLKFTKPLFSFEDCKNQNQHFDIFYVGSDQIWRPIMAADRLFRYFLDFAKKEKTKISYAASFGVDTWEGSEEETKKVAKLLPQFNAISVREESGVSISKQTFNVNACHVLDPTLLLDQEDYKKIESSGISKIKKNYPYAAFYLLDDNRANGTIPNIIQKELKVPAFNLYGKTNKLFGKNLFRFNTVGNWLTGIRNSDFVITDSYHCVIFSIIYKKKFICILNEKKGTARITSLLNSLKLEDRVCSKDSINFDLLREEIDYETVYKNLNKLRSASFNFLNSALNSPVNN